jgi:hypothetical protein
MFMNRYDVELAVQRYANGTNAALSQGALFLQAFVEETDDNSDGWSTWPLPARAASQLMTMLSSGLNRHPTGADYQKALRPIKAFYTRRGYAAGMRFPTV